MEIIKLRTFVVIEEMNTSEIATKSRMESYLFRVLQISMSSNLR